MAWRRRDGGEVSPGCAPLFFIWMLYSTRTSGTPPVTVSKCRAALQPQVPSNGRIALAAYTQATAGSNNMGRNRKTAPGFQPRSYACHVRPLNAEAKLQAFAD